MDAPTRIEVRPYGDSPGYLVAEVYRGIEIEVVYCYLVNETSNEKAEKILVSVHFSFSADSACLKT